jgi:hypothetical protein
MSTFNPERPYVLLLAEDRATYKITSARYNVAGPAEAGDAIAAWRIIHKDKRLQTEYITR